MKETKYYGFCGAEDTNVGLAVLENGEWLLVREDGTAVSQSGQRYVRISREVEAEPMPADDLILYFCEPQDWDTPTPQAEAIPDTDLITLGWTTKADRPQIIPLGS